MEIQKFIGKPKIHSQNQAYNRFAFKIFKFAADRQKYVCKKGLLGEPLEALLPILEISESPPLLVRDTLAFSFSLETRLRCAGDDGSVK